MKYFLRSINFMLAFIIMLVMQSAYAYNYIADGIYTDNAGTLYICNGVNSLEDLNLNPSTIYCFATTPPLCNASTFTNFNAALHVPSTSLGAYFIADYWSNFSNIIADAIAPSEINISENEVEVFTDEQFQLSAIVSPTNATPNTITWVSTKPSIASVSTTGMVTSRAAGECDIIAKCVDKQAVCHVKVHSILEFEYNSVTVERTRWLTLTPICSPIIPSLSSISWSTTNPSIALVDNGTITGVNVGSCSIIANYNGVRATCQVTVIEPHIDIFLDKHIIEILPNHMQTLTLNMIPWATDLIVTSSNPSVAAARLVNGTVQVVGLTEGQTSIIVNSIDNNAVGDTCKVIVHTLLGDVDKDGYITIGDISSLIDYLLGMEMVDNPSRCDTNRDGMVNISDVAMLIDYLLGSVDINPEPELTDVPIVTTEVNENAVYITASGNGSVVLYVNGQIVNNPYVAVRSRIAPYTVSAYATAQEEGKKKSESETSIITIPTQIMFPYESFTVNGVTFQMIGVEGGTFMMGNSNYNDTKPVHQVTLSSFAIGKTEVSQELWQAVMGNNPSYFYNSYADDYVRNLKRPVESISWDDCQAFIAELNRLTGRHFRLPTEAEWEYAARGGNQSHGYNYSGSNNIDDVTWYIDNIPSRYYASRGYGTQQCATKYANELGVNDMSGNVYEWCQDFYDANYYTSEAQINPTGPSSGSYHVIRGGAWHCFYDGCMVWLRSFGPTLRGHDLGLRLAL